MAHKLTSKSSGKSNASTGTRSCPWLASVPKMIPIATILLGRIESFRFVEARFRAFIYGQMENLSASWEASTSADEKEIPQLGAFAREIATWICQQDNSFYISDLTNYVNSTNRSLNSNLLAEVSRDVESSIRTLVTVV